MNLEKPIIVLCCMLILQGCYPLLVGDGAFKVNGSIKNNNDEPISNCTIELRDNEDKVWWGPRKIGSKFEEQFTVAPFSSLYWLIIDCPRYKSQKVLVDYGEKVTPTTPLELGTVVFMQME